MKAIEFLSRLSARASVFCVLFALITLSSSARADQTSDCQAQCDGLPSREKDACISDCLQNGGCSNSQCRVTCGPGVFPQCGTGTCNKVQACVNAGCACKIILTKYCECVP
jgi:hypothetical protein